MNDNIKISVIIPIYNAEKYLSKAIESVLNQTEKNIECILVDDGSTDSSGDICDQYAKQDERIHVIHKENGGLSTARNAGIKVATGTHISFIDADDYLDLETYEMISTVIEEQNPDCIDFGWKYISDTGEVSYNLNKLEKEGLLSLEIIQNKILPPLLNLVKDDNNFIYDFAVNKIYKKDILFEKNILFDETRRTWEDRVFVVEYLKYCNNFYSMNQCYYNYVSVPNSLSRRYDLNFFNIILKNYKRYRELFEEQYDFETTYVRNYWCHSIENMILRSLRENVNKDEIEENIVNVLKMNEVKEWFQLRLPENKFEEKISKLVVNGQVEEVIFQFRKKIFNQHRKSKYIEIKGIIKYVIKKLIGYRNKIMKI